MYTKIMTGQDTKIVNHEYYNLIYDYLSEYKNINEKPTIIDIDFITSDSKARNKIYRITFASPVKLGDKNVYVDKIDVNIERYEREEVSTIERFYMPTDSPQYAEALKLLQDKYGISKMAVKDIEVYPNKEGFFSVWFNELTELKMPITGEKIYTDRITIMGDNLYQVEAAILSNGIKLRLISGDILTIAGGPIAVKYSNFFDRNNDRCETVNLNFHPNGMIASIIPDRGIGFSMYSSKKNVLLSPEELHLENGSVIEMRERESTYYEISADGLLSIDGKPIGILRNEYVNQGSTVDEITRLREENARLQVRIRELESGQL
ncbi:MAG: hypothetical protein LBK68_05410 [Candidatus Margulisbacteria bacterium]|jgi:hypothetical protein|nr:hypothetical protein [Candidatus Margulisiibacteriota bacterium]